MSRMGSSKLWGKIIVLVAVCGWGLSAQAKYDGGSGTQAEPYRISAVPDWQELMATPADWASHFVLTADIDLNDVTLIPVGNNANHFTGVFDGNDYVIRNADVNMPGSDYVGLFGYLGAQSQIKDFGVEDASIFSTGWYVGGLAGYNYNGTISNCYSEGSVTGDDYVGGLVGGNFGTITNCYSTGSVTGNSRVGGLVGCNYSGAIINCYSTGTVSGTGHYVGGLVGINDYASISNCYSTGSVNGEDCVGGLVGVNLGIISNCYSTRDVNGVGDVGGLVGANGRWRYRGGAITNCYSTGDVNGYDYVGGLVGANERGSVSNCYSIGDVSGSRVVGGLVGVNGIPMRSGGIVSNCYSTGDVNGVDDVGGLVGDIYEGYIEWSFWDVQTSDCNTSAAGTGKTTAEMKTRSTFTDAGWDFIEVWDIGENQTYPFLTTYAPGDIDHDGVVDFRDIAHLAESWLRDVR